MANFGRRSLLALSTCDPRWDEIMNVVIKSVDCSVLEGHRGAKAQDDLFNFGRSKVKYPNSKHNELPSKALDSVPFPIDWNDIERMRAFAFFVKGVAAALGYKVRLGADWDGDFTCKDQTFHDLPHMELIE